MKITMLKSAKGSEDGNNVKLYKEGHIYDVSDDLGQAFFEDGACELYQEKAMQVPENKAIKPPENKKRKKK
jgi:hypothetical protein